MRFFFAEFRQADIRPACETIFKVPGALPMANQNEFVH
jgi:hypothetical protein